MNSSKGNLSIEDAIAYVTSVKVRFQEKRENYDQFLKVLCDFRAERIDARGVKSRVNELFKGHNDLILGFNIFMPTEYEIKLPLDLDDEQQQQGHGLGSDDALAFLRVVKDVFKDEMGKYDEFLKVLRDFRNRVIDRRDVAERVKEMFKGHLDLIFGFNAFLPKDYQITLTSQLDCHETGKEVKKVADNCQLPWDVLGIILRRLDFDDLFQFAGVCKNWRAFHKIYWTSFLASQEPLVFKKLFNDKKSFSFISITDQKVYHSKTINCFSDFAYSGCSSGYLIMTESRNSFMLLNPFTRRKKVINTSAFQVNCSDLAYHVLLAFGKDSEEFVLVALCKNSNSLHVYQSQNFGWVTYSTMGKPWMVVDFVVLHNTIYVVTDKATIGVLNLNSANINFLQLKGTPSVTSSSHLRLVSCNGQLLVTHFKSEVLLNVYNIDFSTMNYVKLETLGNVALFYASGRNCYALSNPGRWGYESNSVYVINFSSIKCRVYSRDDNTDGLPVTPRTTPYLLDWCFRYPHYEVDSSHVE